LVLVLVIVPNFWWQKDLSFNHCYKYTHKKGNYR